MTATPAMQAPMLAFAPVERLDFEVGAGVEVGEAGEVVWYGDVEVGVLAEEVAVAVGVFFVSWARGWREEKGIRGQMSTPLCRLCRAC